MALQRRSSARFLWSSLALFLWLESSNCYLPHPHHHRRPRIKLQSSSSTQQEQETETVTEETKLSDVDARVLQSMLRDQTGNEDDVRQLLERGTVKTTKKQQQQQQQSVNNKDTPYSSQVLQTLADTQLWRQLSRQAQDAAASARLWIANKVENDVQVLAALGLFAWDRAVRDVARALPAAGETNKRTTTIFQLTNRSSFVEATASEVQDVSKQVFEILSGEGTTTATGRGLKTAAPAGRAGAAERQKRAYQRSQQQRKQQRDVTRVGGAAVDTFTELKRELQAERNAPGYRSKPVREAIAAAAQRTGNLLEAAQQEARLAAAKRKELRQLESSGSVGTTEETVVNASTINGDATTTIPDAPPLQQETTHQQSTKASVTTNISPAQNKLLRDLQREHADILRRLVKCIDTPNATWLTPSVVDQVRDQDIFAGTGMQEAVTQMILLKADMQRSSDKLTTLDQAVAQLTTVRDKIRALIALVSESVAAVIGNQFRRELFQEDPQAFFVQEPLLLRLEEVVAAAVAADQQAAADEAAAAAAPTNQSTVIAEEATTTPAVESSVGTTFDEDISKVKATTSPAVDAPPTDTFVDEPTHRIVKPSSVTDSTFNVDNAESAPPPPSKPRMEPEFVDVDIVMGEIVPDTVVMEFHEAPPASIRVDESIDAAGAGLLAEIVSDEDFDRAFGEAKVVVEVTDQDEQEEEKEDSIVVQAALRALDVTFFVLEKLIGGVPVTIATTQRVVQRVAEVNRDGRGTKGWTPVKNLANTKGRY